MKTHFGILILTLFVSVTTYCQNNETITYSDNRKLKFEDFQLVYNDSFKYGGMTSTQIKCRMDVFDDTIKLTVVCEFKPKESYINKNKDGKLLNHEQLHFDLKELWARRLRKKLINEKFSVISAEDSIILFFNIYNDSAKMEGELYDKETNHSLNEPMQDRWEKKILNGLKELVFFQMSELVYVKRDGVYKYIKDF